MALFKNRSFNVKVVKDQTEENHQLDSDRNPYEGADVFAAYAEVAKDFITHTALTIGGVYAAYKIVERIFR